MAVRTLPRGSRHGVGCFHVPNPQFRSPLFGPAIEGHHSSPLEAGPNLMNSINRDMALRWVAIAMGLGVSTGSSLGIAVAAGMAILCLMRTTRRASLGS